MNPIIAWQLASRYLRGKRSGNAVPVLSRISMLAIAVGSCAMIVLFSVFNGFEGVVRDLYKAFYPDIRISPARGKFFAPDANQLKLVKNLKGVLTIAPVIEDNVLVNSNDEQIVVTLKGVTPDYFKVNDVEPYIVEGRDSISEYPVPTAIIGSHIRSQLGIDVDNVFNDLHLFYPNAKSQNLSLNPESAFQSLRLKPDGVFRVQDDFDSKYVLCPLPFAQQLFSEDGHVSTLELSLDPKTDPELIKSQLQSIFGSSFRIETRFEQNRTLYLVMRTEKWAVYAILLLVLVIASFNMVGALSLLVLEKEKDMAILKAMGANNPTVRAIFIIEGVLWALVGGAIGILAGAGICLGQQQFKWVKLEGQFIIDAYPVTLQPTDFLLVIITVVIVGVLAAIYPSLKATRVEAPSLRTT